jgi:hypothetical protein
MKIPKMKTSPKAVSTGRRRGDGDVAVTETSMLNSMSDPSLSILG